jgi:uncharacterized RDD family membrane protein YckC
LTEHLGNCYAGYMDPTPAPIPPVNPPVVPVAPVSPVPAGVFTQTPVGTVYAGFWRRFLAVFLDVIIVEVIAIVVTLPIGIAFGVASGISSDSGVAGIFSGMGSLVGGLIGMVVGFGYPMYFIGSRGQTPGKMALGVKVQRLDGQTPPGIGTALLREVVGKFLSSFLCLGYLWMLWDEKKQTWHDKIAGTVVVRV